MLVADIEFSKCATFKEVGGNGPIAIISQGNIAKMYVLVSNIDKDKKNLNITTTNDSL